MNQRTRALSVTGARTHWFFWVLAGLLLGVLVRAGVAYACSCALPSWQLTLSETTSTNPDVDHSESWPVTMAFRGSPGYLWLEAHDDNPD